MKREYIDAFHLYKNDIYRLAYSYTKNKADADDITQNVLIKMHQHFYKFDNESVLKKWWVKVTINECKNLFKTVWKRKILPISSHEGNMEVITPSQEENPVLTAAQSLSQKYRTVIHLYYYEEYKVSEIAEILKTKESTIISRLFRARKILKDKLEGGWNDEE